MKKMYLQFFLLITIMNLFNCQQYKDTDCHKKAGNSSHECKLFTTFIDRDPIRIEENVLYLCCYVNTTKYQGCQPIKEEIVFDNTEGLSFDCKSLFNKVRFIFIFICMSCIF